MDKGKKKEEVSAFNLSIEVATLRYENARLKENVKMLQGERPGLLKHIADGQKVTYELNEYIRLLRTNMANLRDENTNLTLALQAERVRYDNLASYMTQRQQMRQNDMRAVDDAITRLDTSVQNNGEPSNKRPRNTKSPAP